jgi:hypothetical protein
MSVTGVPMSRTPAAAAVLTTTAGTTFEASTAAAVSAATTAISSAVSTTIGATATAAAIAAAAAEWPLKTRTGIAAANASGLARKFFARFIGASGSARARFAGKQNDVFDQRSGFAIEVRSISAGHRNFLTIAGMEFLVRFVVHVAVRIVVR